MDNDGLIFWMQCGRMAQKDAKRMVPRFPLATKCMIISFFEDRISRLDLSGTDMNVENLSLVL